MAQLASILWLTQVVGGLQSTFCRWLLQDMAVNKRARSALCCLVQGLLVTGATLARSGLANDGGKLKGFPLVDGDALSTTLFSFVLAALIWLFVIRVRRRPA